ncbi:biotin carboxylase N-terminal domain-containing protein [Candidatus Haliotispira prima]|uniref:biotin carboxylase n=1 Tax=Candidatus Haliotispira prima TaxID=3034016 RepID=A0ABY8MH63_9SPIO|nr:biotin carboxylase N-terminal domain-containing protein [Candidatus Haliotispira prima]
MIKSLLIANRGEIAVRIIRTCRELGIKTVAVYSEADRDALHVKMADKAYCIGPPPSAKSYLRMDSLVTVAANMQCDAIHPGVGFLSENADFAGLVREHGMTFIGAKPEVIKALGDKVEAKRIAEEVGIRTIPGSKEAINGQVEKAGELAAEMGYPVIIKAAAGGGGRGMRIVEEPGELAKALTIAANEAESNFADGTVYMEKYLFSPRHVEIQVLGDGRDNVLHLGERDCSVQKNHQKLLEESPSTVVSGEMREKMGQDAIRLFRHLNYAGAGTIEFLVCEGQYYFMEVNARVQVEHTVTEMTTGVDIIRQQILGCVDGKMEVSQDDIRIRGYALEARINALTPGLVTKFEAPLGPMTRTDTFLYSGCNVSPYYDSMVAKIIVQAMTREEGLKRMERALHELVIEGIKVNVDEQLTILQSPAFRTGKFGTDVYNKIIAAKK